MSTRRGVPPGKLPCCSPARPATAARRFVARAGGHIHSRSVADEADYYDDDACGVLFSKKPNATMDSDDDGDYKRSRDKFRSERGRYDGGGGGSASSSVSDGPRGGSGRSDATSGTATRSNTRNR